MAVNEDTMDRLMAALDKQNKKIWDFLWNLQAQIQALQTQIRNK